MAEVRVENEIKMYSPGGAFSFDGNDPSAQMDRFVSLFTQEGFRCGKAEASEHTDYYYTDIEGMFDSLKILLRYRDLGSKALVTMKMPTVRNGAGLSRREIEGEVFNDSRFDRWKSVQDYANEVYGPVEIGRTPRLVAGVVRGRCPISSNRMEYTFTFDRIVYRDPGSGVRSRPCYELEFESLDKAIDDPAMDRLVDLLSDKYLFEEERISKYERGLAFLRQLR